MFDIGFWEMAIIAVVALVVIGPERLPAVARTVGVWVGKARQFVGSVQQDINREVNKSEELTKLIKEQSELSELHEIIEQTVDETRKTVAVGADLNTAPKHEVKSLNDDEDQTESLNTTESNTAQANTAKSTVHKRKSTADAVNEKGK